MNKNNNLSIFGVVLITLSVLVIAFNVIVETGIFMDTIAIVLTLVIPLLSMIVAKEYWVRPTKSKKLNEFHQAFGYKSGKYPAPLSIEEIRTRNKFATEELVEAVFGTVRHDEEEFRYEMKLFITLVKEVALETIEKNKNKPAPISDGEVLVEQVDGFIDAIYFLEGTFDMLGVDSTPIFEIVHSANMNKLDKHGKPIIRVSDGKIQKPEGWVAPEPLIKKEIQKQINETKLDDIIEK